MARLSKDAQIDLTVAHDLTIGLIDALRCPDGKQQAFLRDRKAPGLRVRVTATGAKSFVFEAKLNRETIRRTIGSAGSKGAWSIDAARTEANRLRVTLDTGIDPRDQDKQKATDAEAKRAAADRASIPVGEAWAVYIEERRPQWGDLHYRDHQRKASPGGEPVRRGARGTGTTQPGPLASLMPLRLAELDSSTIEAWASWEAAERPTSARLAWRLLKVFLGWCAEHPVYGPLMPPKNPAKTMRAREAFGRAAAKSDVLQREQLATWFQHVQALGNRAISAALQVMLLTGARPSEVLDLRWEDVNFEWRGLSIGDKVEGVRVIPATPYVVHLMSGLPRANEWVFASATFIADKTNHGRWVSTSESGRISSPNYPHERACAAAGLDGLTLHGLRRSFASLTEWLEVPAGVVAQIMGHKPSATAERHYKVRPLELLRVHHERIEAWMLEQANVPFSVTASPRLKVVKTPSKRVGSP